MAEAAELLRCHPTTLYRLLRAGKIPGAFKLGSDWRIDEAVFLRELIEHTSTKN